MSSRIYEMKMRVAPDPELIMGLYLLTAYIEVAIPAECRLTCIWGRSVMVSGNGRVALSLRLKTYTQGCLYPKPCAHVPSYAILKTRY
jgi:hypothetical protein